jgi:uncharacterized membrane protein YeaQ/YmgE (transglycosylase-associated protein family)
VETLGAILVWAVFGLIVGAIARLLYPGKQTMGLLATMLLGIVGSLVGGFLSWIVTGGPGEPFHAAGWIMSIVGAVIVVWIYLASTREHVA